MVHLTHAELLALLSAARERRERDHCLFLVTFCHGLRASETIALTHANFVGGSLTIQRLKGSVKTRQKLVSAKDPLLDEVSTVARWLKIAPILRADPRLFAITRIQFWRLMQLYCDLAGIPEGPKRRPHVFKHTLAMVAIEAGMKIHKVQKLLGHKSGGSTMKYFDTTDDEAMAAAEQGIQGLVRPQMSLFGK